MHAQHQRQHFGPHGDYWFYWASTMPPWARTDTSVPQHGPRQVNAIRQKRICEYFGLPCTHFRTFLDFPVAVRLHIYELAGVVTDTEIHLMPGREVTELFGPTQKKDSFDLTLSLLQTCIAVHDDVMTMVVSRNTLLVLVTGLDYGLSFLRRLAPQHCYHMTDLHIHLHEQFKDETSTEKERFLKARHVTAWIEAAENVLANVKPRILNLHLIYDSTSNSSHTSDVVQPLLKFPGVLADCELRLGAKRATYLSTLALETACRVTGNYTEPALRKGAFPFFELPQELRKSVLEFTDLVTPYRQVQWSPQTGFSCNFRLHSCSNKFCMEELHYGCQFRFCGRGVSRELAGWNQSQSVCRARHSSYSSSCHCWMAPGYLMLVSREMYHDAMAVFYSQNRIIAGQTKDVYRPIAGVSSIRLAASRFITRHIWPRVLWHINTLELVFPPLETSRCYSLDDPAWRDWHFAVDHLAVHSNVKNLTLVIHIIHTEKSRRIHLDQLELLRLPHTIANSQDFPFLSYTRLLFPLRARRCMKNFFLHFTEPRDPEDPGSDYVGPSTFVRRTEKPASYIHKREMFMEKLIMSDEYDSDAAGKGEWERTRWLGGFETYM